MEVQITRNVTVLIIGDYLSQYGNIDFDSISDLNKKIDECIDEFGIGCVSVYIEDIEEFTEEELTFLEENGVEF
jgi:hypothetical protein